MTMALIVSWLGFVSLIGLNGFAAGVVGVLHAWRLVLARSSRILISIALAALLFASSMMALVFAGTEDREISGGSVTLAVVFGMGFALAAVVSLPGALLMARKVEAPADTFRVFE